MAKTQAAMASSSSYLNRAADVILEDGAMRNMLGGVFDDVTLRGFEESLQLLVPQTTNFAALLKRARKKGRGTLARVLEARQLALKLVANARGRVPRRCRAKSSPGARRGRCAR